MATGPSVANSGNAFVPNWEASGKLRVAFTRNKKSFCQPAYTKMVGTPKPVGFWKRWLNQKAARVISQNRFAWPDGKPRPKNGENEQFEYIQFRCKRNSYDYTLGLRTKEYADEDIAVVERNSIAAQHMTARSLRCISLATTTANWDTTASGNLSSNHEATTSALTTTAGVTIGDISAGSSTDPRILNMLGYAQSLIAIDTLGVVTDAQSINFLWMNPNTARKLGKSQEIHDYLKGSPDAYRRITGKLSNPNKYGLPDEIYGCEILIDDTIKVTSERKGTLAKSFAFPDAAIVLGFRNGETDAEASYDKQTETVDAGAQLSTITMFHVEDASVEEFTDPKNRLLEGFIAEDTVEVLTCPETGFYFQSVFTD